MTKITKRCVDAAAPGDQEFFLWDDELNGFGLRGYPSSRKMYLAQFRVSGRLRRVNIGLHGAVTPDIARTEAMKHLSQARLGADPTRDRDRRKTSPILKEFGQRFLDNHVASHCKPSTHAEYKRSVEIFINPKLGSHRIIDITRADVVEMHHSMKTTPYQANRTLGVLSVMFTVAQTWGVRTDGVNPCWKIKRYKEAKRERYLTPSEHARLGQVLREADGEVAIALGWPVSLITIRSGGLKPHDSRSRRVKSRCRVRWLVLASCRQCCPLIVVSESTARPSSEGAA